MSLRVALLLALLAAAPAAAQGVAEQAAQASRDLQAAVAASGDGQLLLLAAAQQRAGEADAEAAAEGEAEGEGSGEIQSQFGLVLKLGWKIVQLATACGFRKHGDSNEIDPRWWDKFTGATGECVIAHRKFAKKGESKDKSAATWTGVSNEITEFVAAEGAGEREF
jgi:hypothetical protein